MKDLTHRSAELIRHAAKAIGVMPAALIGKGVRTNERISYARFVVWHQLWTEGNSYNSIATAFQLDHGTIMNGVRKVHLLEEIKREISQ